MLKKYPLEENLKNKPVIPAQLQVIMKQIIMLLRKNKSLILSLRTRDFSTSTKAQTSQALANMIPHKKVWVQSTQWEINKKI